ncbi:dna-binding protein rfx7 [Lasius niger]|uniref:Dna-binding protein rfx7 n=1 Tax=Lasius niger TaxID=67767 RepID=A0A0J7KGN0_LASNI|nr:dna-binding protein rfx7 [Lasius niger]
MSTDSHDQTKTPCKVSGRSEVEENMFDGKRIKKEHGDICAENGDAAVTAATAAVVEKGQLPAGRFTSNGFHGDGDLLQDLIATKFTTLANHSASSKQDKIRIMIEDGIRLKVNFIF